MATDWYGKKNKIILDRDFLLTEKDKNITPNLFKYKLADRQSQSSKTYHISQIQ